MCRSFSFFFSGMTDEIRMTSHRPLFAVFARGANHSILALSNAAQRLDKTPEECRRHVTTSWLSTQMERVDAFCPVHVSPRKNDCPSGGVPEGLRNTRTEGPCQTVIRLNGNVQARRSAGKHRVPGLPDSMEKVRGLCSISI